MKRILVLLVLIFSVMLSIAQDQSYQPYFQQEVNYDIEVTLDDVNHLLVGEVNIEYVNHSPDALEKIYFHLWANAYKNHKTAFAKQQIQNGYSKFFFAKKSEMGGYNEVDFFVNNQKATWALDEKNIDIALLELREKLLPEQSIQIRVPFVIKIPNYFSRMGHVDQAYYISQWYPKPAVYDRSGWHPMPYLDMGEFYSEFGKYDVKITLPQNYYVASTGKLETATEINFINSRARATNRFKSKHFPRGADMTIPLSLKDTFPESSSQMKTIRFTAENVHDFAWFADKRFFIKKNKLQVGPEQEVELWAFFNMEEFHLWWNAPKYLEQAVGFYSRMVGTYPYPQATAVSNPYADAGAMEYPMITLVDQMYDPKTLDMVIAHEVGHNWFYGILAFNERDHAWLDEGINTLYERLYEKNFYPDKKNDEYLPKIMETEGQLSGIDLVKASLQRENLHQAITTPNQNMTETNYGIGVYDRTADALTGRIPSIKMKAFFNQWKFKHPQVIDFLQHFNLENDKVFHQLMHTNEKVDYECVSVSKSGDYELVVKNNGKIPQAFQVTMISDGEKKIQNIEGFTGEKTLKFKAPNNGEFDEFIIDEDRQIPDFNRKNNSIRTSGVFKKIEPFQFKFLGGAENPTRTTLYWLPALAWNNYDKTTLGVVLHNNNLAARNFEFVLAPMYGTASKNLVGTGEVKWNLFPENSLFQRMTLSLNAKRFTYRYNGNKKYYDTFLKLAPKLEFNFKKKKLTSSVQHKLSYRYVNIALNNGFTTIDNPDVVQRNKSNYYVNELKYTFEDSKVTSPLKVELTAHQGDGFFKIFANAKQFFPYGKKGKGTTLKAFAGWIPQLDNPPAFVSFTWGGITNNVSIRDYMFDESLLGRTQADGIFSQQYFNRDANLRTLSSLGSSQDWMISLGLSTTVPGPLPVRLYADGTIYRGFDFNKFEEGTLFSYSTGIALVAIPDAIEIYFPVFESSDIRESLTYADGNKDTFIKRVSFLFDLNQLQKKGKEIIKFY